MSLDDVQRITDGPILTSDTRFDDVDAPRDAYGKNAPQSCAVIFNRRAAFDAGWTQFHSVTYTGASNMGVRQAVGVYPEVSAAHDAFDRIVSESAKCAALHADGYEITLQRPSPSTLLICFDVCKVQFRWKSSVLIDVSVQHFSNESERIADEVVQVIAGRIGSE